MPTFQYTGRDNQGQAVAGNIEANSIDAVATQLINTRVTPVNITQAQKEKTNA